MAPHFSTLAWKIPWMEEPGGLQSLGSLEVGHDWVTSLSLFTFMQCRRKWQPTPVFLPGESHGWRSLVGYSPWGHKESDMTERLHFHFQGNRLHRRTIHKRSSWPRWSRWCDHLPRARHPRMQSQMGFRKHHSNKASGGDGILVVLFQVLKDDAVKALHSIFQQIWITQQWPQDWKRSVVIPIPKKGNAKEC